MKEACVMVRSREQAARQRPDATNLRHQIIHEYAKVDTESGEEKRQSFIAQLREQKEQARTPDDAICRNLEELGFEG